MIRLHAAAFSLLMGFHAHAGALRLTLPPAWYAVPGSTVSLYFDNVVLTERPEAYRFEVRCDIGSAKRDRWEVLAGDTDVGSHALEVTVKDEDGAVIEHATTVLHVAPRDAGKSSRLSLLVVGDSLTAASAYPMEIARLLATPGNPEWTMHGNSKHPEGGLAVAHEGYGGWKWADFLSKWSPQPAGVAAGPVARRATSPFLFPAADGKGAMDLPRYFQEQCEGRSPDVVTFLLGINDCFGASPDDAAAMDKHIDGVLANADKVLDAFHKADPKIALAIGLTTPPNARESGFEANYHGKYHRWGWKRIQHRLVERMIARYASREAENLFLVPTELNLDPVGGYPNNNGVHPNGEGYVQLGTSFYAWLKHWLAAR